ncbi:MAG: hypothetical protein ACRYG2_29415, partial [Janthinobacterium lividum]
MTSGGGGRWWFRCHTSPGPSTSSASSEPSPFSSEDDHRKVTRTKSLRRKSGRPGRRQIYDRFGVDAVDGGGLAEVWRLDADQPTFVIVQTAGQLRDNLAAARRT